MRLYKLIGLEIDALQKEHSETLKNIAKYEDILDNHSSMSKVIVGELKNLKKNYEHPRKTQIVNAAEAVFEEKKMEEMNKQMADQTMEAAKAVGNAKGLSVVLPKDAVLYGGVDITDQVLKKLASDAK